MLNHDPGHGCGGEPAIAGSPPQPCRDPGAKMAQVENCVEVADAASCVMVRDTTNRDGGTLAFAADAWQTFLAALR